MFELLQTNDNCELPCFWRIIPKQTPIEEVELFVNHLGCKSVYYRDSIRNNFHTGSGILYDEFGFSISFEDESEIVGSISTQIGFGKRIPFVPYSVKEILSTYGVPERIGLNLVYVTGFEFPRQTAGYKNLDIL